MKYRLIVAAALAALAGAVCARQEGQLSPSPSPGGSPPAAAPVKNANVAAADMGGAVEELTGNFGPGDRKSVV